MDVGNNHACVPAQYPELRVWRGGVAPSRRAPDVYAVCAVGVTWSHPLTVRRTSCTTVPTRNGGESVTMSPGVETCAHPHRMGGTHPHTAVKDTPTQQ